MLRKSFLLFYTLGCALSINTVLGCGGYQLITHKLQNCAGSPSDIKLQNFNVSLGEDCKVIAHGCIENKKDFKTSKVHYKISKGALYQKEGHDDLCASLPKASDDIKVMISLFMPATCPVKARKICGGKDFKLDLSKYKQSMYLLTGSPLKAWAMMTTEAGLSCMEFEGEMKKKS